MKRILLVLLLIAISACENLSREDVIYGDESTVSFVYASVETTPVASRDDAADDPAIWYNSKNPSQSLILGTDKKAGIGVYNLDGDLIQFIEAGLPNNIDLRQNLDISGWTTDLAAASNRAGDVITLFTVNEKGVSIVGSFPAGLPEPYGSCMGFVSGQLIVFVTYKTGEVQAHRIDAVSSNNITQEIVTTIPFSSQLEGCVHDDDAGILYIGEEGRGLWQTSVSIDGGTVVYSPPKLIDEVGGPSGIIADVEGVSQYKNQELNLLVVSSQGNDSYAVYNANNNTEFVGRFRIGNSEESGIDGAQETDGLATDSRPFGSQYPRGILVVQDGYNMPLGEPQNFKIIDWRDIEATLNIQ